MNFMQIRGSYSCREVSSLCLRAKREKIQLFRSRRYVEDPFDLKHNLGGKCSPAGKKHILDAFKDGAGILRATGRRAARLVR